MSLLFDLSPLTTTFGSILVGVIVSILLGLVVGFVSSMFGIGGGFVITPFFHSILHLPAPLAVATSMGQIAFMSLSGIVEYARQRKIRYREGMLLLIGAIPASQAVALTFGNLRDSTIGNTPVIAQLTLADVVLLLSFGLFLGLVGVYNVYRALGYRAATRADETVSETTDAVPTSDDTRGSTRSRGRPIATLLVGVLFGALSVLLGIGGGFFAVPFFVYALKFDPAEAVATSFFCILVTAVLTTIHYALAGDIYLGLSICIALGSVIGAQGGSRFAIKVAPERLLLSLGILQLVVVLSYVALKLL